MSCRTLACAIVGAALLAGAPLALSAQTDDTPDAFTQGINNAFLGGVYCPHLIQTLTRGMRDSQTVPPGQVTELQKFLVDYYDLNPDDYVTGYFGRLTYANVVRFQREQNLPTFGIVGSLTRAAIARVCDTQSSLPETTWPPPPATSASCAFNGQVVAHTVAHNALVIAYQSATVEAGQECRSEARMCLDGVLSGSYQHATCAAQAPTTPPIQVLCILDGLTIQSGQSHTFYSASTVQSPSSCASFAQMRTCTNGILSGSSAFNKASCSVTQLTNTSTNPGDTIAGPKSCVYKGAIYPDGTVASIILGQQYVCENGLWFPNSTFSPPVGIDICEWGTYRLISNSGSDYGCSDTLSGYTRIGIRPSYGTAPLIVTATVWATGDVHICAAFKISWGDGSSESARAPYPTSSCTDGVSKRTHVYTSPGTYTVTVTSTGGRIPGGMDTRTKTVTVVGPTALGAKDSQVANALTALYSALQALLTLLKYPEPV